MVKIKTKLLLVIIIIIIIATDNHHHDDKVFSVKFPQALMLEMPH
jgi:hypothetical protein